MGGVICFAERVDRFDWPGMFSVDFIAARRLWWRVAFDLHVCLLLVEWGPPDVPGAIVLVVLTSWVTQFRG